MNCIVTAGPTCEPLDQVRRLTNFSTGKLGTLLAHFLVEQGHHVTLLKSDYSIYQTAQKAQQFIPFTTTAELAAQLRALSEQPIHAVFHAAAVSDFSFGNVWSRLPTGELREVKMAKISSRQERLLVELIPTPKILGSLRQWFPPALLVGWKYEVDGDKTSVIARAQQQISEYATDACVANGPAYGAGFGLIGKDGECLPLPDTTSLFEKLGQLHPR